MEWVIGLSLWIFKGILVLFVLLLIAVALLTEWLRYYTLKMQMELPYLKWLTLSDVSKMGFSEFWSRAILPIFYECGQLEIRKVSESEIDEFGQKMIEIVGFHPTTVPYYEFKLTKKGGRKKIKLTDIALALRPIFVPVRKNPA